MNDVQVRIGQDISCPRCDYNLRGLSGAAVVVCPECGDRWDAAALLDEPAARRPPRPLGDVVVITIVSGECLLIAALAAFGMELTRGATAPLLGLGVIVAVWLAACHGFCRLQRSYTRGLWLLAHVVAGLALLIGGTAIFSLSMLRVIRGWSMPWAVGVTLAAWLAGGLLARRACVLSRRDARIARSLPGDAAKIRSPLTGG